MEQSNKINFLLILLTFMVYVFSSCKKEMPTSDPSLFIKTYPTEDSTSIAFYVEQLPDGGFFLVSAVGSSSLILSRTNKYGNLEWEKTVLKSGFIQFYLTSTPPWIFNAYNTGDQGHFLAQSGDFLIKFDSTGKISNSVYNGGINTELIPQGPNYMGASYNGI